MKQPGSNLATPAGLGVLAAIALVAAYFGLRSLEAVALAALLLCLAAFLWTKRALSHVEIALEGAERCAFPGECVSVPARLWNRKLLPVIWLEVRFATGEDPCVGGAEDEGETEEGKTGLSESFLWLMPQQSVSWQQQAKALRRGVCQVEALEIRTSDGFGLTECARQAALRAPFRFVVYPEVRPVEISPILRSMSELEPYSRGLYTDNTLIRSVRDYREGDSFRDVNWRLLARQGKLQVNVREKLAMRRVCLMSDLESFAYTETVEEKGEKRTVRRVRREELERTLSLMASIVAAAQQRDVICTLLLPAYGETAARCVVPEDKHSQVMELLGALAELDYAGEAQRLPAEELSGNVHRLGQPFLFARRLSEAGRALEERLDGLRLIHVVSAAPAEVLGVNVIEERELWRA